MKKIDRSSEARSHSLHKLQKRIGGKGNIRTTILVFVAMIAVASLLFMSLEGTKETENPTTMSAVAGAPEAPEIAAIQAVLTHEFTGPDEEYLRISKDLYKQQNEPTYKGYVGKRNMPDKTEWYDYVEDAYLTYFTRIGFESFIEENPVMESHISNLDYRMNISDIAVKQVENMNAPKAYGFTAKVTYKDKDDMNFPFKISGVAIFSEDGKIDRMTISCDELLTRINEDIGKQTLP